MLFESLNVLDNFLVQEAVKRNKKIIMIRGNFIVILKLISYKPNLAQRGSYYLQFMKKE